MSRRGNVLRLAGLGIACLATAACAQTPADESASAGMDMDTGSMQGGSPPPDARDPHAYAEGVGFTRGEARPQFAGEKSFRSVLIDNFEASRVDGETVVPYDLEAWLGPTFDRAVLKAEGDFEGGDLADARSELLWGHAFAPYWDTQVGVRYDSGEGPARTWLAAGIEGLAPYWFNIEVTAYVGEAGRAALRFEGTHEMLITQRLVLERWLEVNFYGQDDPERGLGDGLSDTALGFRLRYDIRREFAPYIGIERSDKFGGTKDFTRAAGGDSSVTRLTMGIRAWF